MIKQLASAMVVASMALTGCTPILGQEGLPVKGYIGPVPAATHTPADAALICLANTPQVRSSRKMFAVHVITDQTQKFSSYESGGYVPHDSAAMLVTAFAKAGIKQVNRINTAVSEFEIAKAREQILGDGGPEKVGDITVPYRPLMKGSMRGSDYVIDGSITQLDFNTFSGGAQANVFGVGGGAREFALTVGADLRVTDTRSTRIVLARSYTKQAVGKEIYGSIFRFFNDELYDVKIGTKYQEGLHAGVRWLMAEAAYDIVSALVYHNPACDQLLPEATKKLRGIPTTTATVTVVAPIPTPADRKSRHTDT
jgi:curli biogenesis system outer membrane secretion channel CsgG